MKHQAPSLRPVGAIALLFGLLVPVLSLQAQVRDLYVVTDAKAEFYVDRQRQSLSLQTGDVVEGEAHSTYRDWLRVTIGNQSYDTRAKYFLARADHREAYARQRADLLSRIERNSDRIDSAREQTWQLVLASAAIRFDSTVQYREEVLVPVTVVPAQNGTGTQPGARPGDRPNPPRPVLQVEYRYVDKVSPSRAKNQAKHWAEDIDDLTGQVARWTEERRDDIAQVAILDAANLALERRFRLFETNRVTQVAEPYVVVEDKATLYDGQLPVAEMQQEEVALARGNDRFPRWLRVQRPDRVLDGRREHFASRTAVETGAAGRIASLRQLSADLLADIDLLSEREKQLRALCLTLRYESQVTRFPLTVYPFAADYAGRTYYASGTAPKNVAEMVNAVTARSVQRDWEKDLAALQEQIRKLRQRLDSTRRDAAVTEAKAQERSRRLQGIDPAEPTATGVILP